MVLVIFWAWMTLGMMTRAFGRPIAVGSAIILLAAVCGLPIFCIGESIASVLLIFHRIGRKLFGRGHWNGQFGHDTLIGNACVMDRPTHDRKAGFLVSCFSMFTLVIILYSGRSGLPIDPYFFFSWMTLAAFCAAIIVGLMAKSGTLTVAAAVVDGALLLACAAGCFWAVLASARAQ